MATTDLNLMLECPLALNVSRTKDYLLSCSERTFFDWMVIQQIRNGLGHVFPFSVSNIEKSIGIKRKALEKIEKRFAAFGFIVKSIGKNQSLNNGGKITYIGVYFRVILNRLNEVIDEQSESYPLFQKWFAALSKEQDKALKEARDKPKEKQYKTQIPKEIKKLYDTLCEIYKERTEIYNEREDVKARKLFTKFPCNNEILGMLLRLAKRYDNSTIEKAFLVFSDEVLHGKRKNVKNHLKNFAYFDHQKGVFNVVDDCINRYMSDYYINKD